MKVNVVVADKTVVIDGDGRICPDLVAPDDWAHAYSWDGAKGRVEPIQSPDVPFHDVEYFDDVSRVQPFIEQWEANAPPPVEVPSGV